MLLAVKSTGEFRMRTQGSAFHGMSKNVFSKASDAFFSNIKSVPSYATPISKARVLKVGGWRGHDRATMPSLPFKKIIIGVLKSLNLQNQGLNVFLESKHGKMTAMKALI